MVKHLVMGALLAMAALSAGCSEEKADPKAPPESQGEGLSLERSYPAQSSGGIRKPMKTVVRDAASLESLWKRANAHMTPLPKAPTLDFEKQMLALVSLGNKSTGGWSVEIVGARAVGDTTLIMIAERAPAEGAMTTQAETQPWHAVILPRRDGPVEWPPYVAPGSK
ncbi:MAG: protease complex subunit PrcB family protein [Planctomycetota bacterium]|jgi:hypothetical protein